MGRETDDEREARLKQAGRWLEAELSRRDWTQKHVAGELGVAPQQVSAYVNGRYEVDPELARDVARLFGMSELQVWKGMRIALPRELATEQAIIRWVMDRMPAPVVEAWGWATNPEVMAKGTGSKPPKQARETREASNRPTKIAQPGDKRRRPPHRQENAG